MKIHYIIYSLLIILLAIASWFGFSQKSQLEAAKKSARIDSGKSEFYRASTAHQQKLYPDTLLHAAKATGFAGKAPEGSYFLTQEDDAQLFAEAEKWSAEGPAYYPVGSEKIEGGVATLAVSPKGDFCLAGGTGPAKVWNFSSNSNVTVAPEPANAFAVGPEGKKIAVAKPTAVVIMADGEELNSWDFKTSALAFHPKEEKLAAACDDGVVRIFSDKRIEEVGKFGENIRHLAFGPNGNSIAAVIPEKGVRLFLLNSKQQNRFWSKLDLSSATALAINPDPARNELAVGMDDGSITRWSLAGAQAIAEPLPLKTAGKINALDYAPDGSALLAAADNGKVYLLDTTGESESVVKAVLNGHNSAATQVSFFPGGTLAISGDDSGLLRIWNVDGEAKPAATGLYDYIEKGWYSFDKSTNALVSAAGTGFLNLPKDSVVASWKSGSEPELAAPPSLTTELPKQKQNYKNGLGIDLVWCKPGSFKMGEINGPEFARQFTSKISKGFWMGKYEISQAQYQAVMKTNPSVYTENANAPVESVEWGQAIDFCDKLNSREEIAGRLPKGWRYALPTEAQWEYACRAGTKGKWSFGEKIGDLKKHANFESGDDGFSTIAPIGSYPANPWGLHDLHGNVFEWCRDGMDVGNPDYPTGTVTDYFSSKGSLKVVRGGSFDAIAAECISTYRDAESPKIASPNLGFRIVLVPESSLK